MNSVCRLEKNTPDKEKIRLGFPWHHIVNHNQNILSNLHTCGGAFVSFSHELSIAMLNNETKTEKNITP